ncbi:MAG: H-NS histone family protein [Methylococcales bacterium]|nr:H-NS histone family protein [Methylococcales bacterium]
MSEYKNLSENELQVVIKKAEKALKEKKVEKRKEVIAQIRKLSDSIGVTVEIIDIDNKRAKTVKKVSAKYCHPDDSSQTWTGRGLTPKWMKELVDSGRDKSEFLI